MSTSTPHPDPTFARYLRVLKRPDGTERWSMRLYHSHSPAWVPLKVATRQAAEQIFVAYDVDPETWEQRLRSRRASGLPLQYIMEAMFASMAQGRKRREATIGAVRSLQEHVGDGVGAGRITQAMCSAWVKALEGRGLATNSVTTWVKAVRTVFNFAVREGLLAENPTRRLRANFVRAEDRTIITAREALDLFPDDAWESQRLFRPQLPQWMRGFTVLEADVVWVRAWVRTSFWLAARPEEIERLRGDHDAIVTEGERTFARVVQTKINGRKVHRFVPVRNRELILPEILLWIAAPDRVARPNPLRIQVDIEGRRTLGRAVNRADLRASGITAALAAGEDIYTVARHTGTSVQQIERTYARMLREQERPPLSLVEGGAS